MERVAAAPSLIKRTFEGLQKRIELGGGRLFLQDDSGEAGRYACSFQPPATAEEIQSLLDSTGLDMPGSYLELLQLTNGCSLFDHELYGGASCLIAADQAEHLYETYQEPGYLMIAVVFDDRIVMDCEKYARGEEDYMLVGNSAAPVKELTSLGSDFETWFSRFVVSNGAKFWTWRSAGAMPGYSKG
ncbi:SMI1/KNR4 family protein [Paenibacillus sp. B01]|uniref:SMI1/KNR4 family protein n=1 Tax=Paenibacillus sp. B01 TaxID=2660554 RepID=UPI002B2714C6|nr:SMI1/KNR4 family protein [Paenibacillus sp. B01]